MSVLTDQEIRGVLDKELVIHPFDENNCLAPFGYDLRIGYAFNLTTQNTTAKSATGKITIPSKTSIFILTKEHIWLSEMIGATLHSRGSLSVRGLFLNSTNVDPNWKGQLTCLIYNASDYPVELEEGERFATMLFHRAKIPTKNAPSSNPLKVVEQLGKVYGEKFSTSLLAYAYSHDMQAETKEFEQKIHIAQTPSPSTMFWSGVTSIVNSIGVFFKSRFSNVISGFIWVLTFFVLIIAFTIQWYWSWLQQIFHFSEPYGPTTLIGQVAVVVAALGVLRSLLKK